MINSQFFITHYTGRESLDLMSIPTAFANDPIKISEYERFIQSIDTIYGSQNLDGEIPKFWTRRTQTIDALGNIVYSNEPHPESTLTSLTSMASYYFILRDSSDVPVKIPINGGEVYGFTDISSLPIVASVTSCTSALPTGTTCSQITLKDNNLTDIIFNLENLRPYDSYVYEIGSIGANWPVDVTPVSGLIKPATPSGSIEINALFCPSTGVCGSNILEYSLSNDCLLKNPNTLYATIQLKVRPVSSDLEIYSDHYSLFCEDCLPPKPSCLIKSVSSNDIENEATINEADFEDNPYHEFKIEIQEQDALVTDKNYSYSIESLSAEWPVIFISPTGGIATISKGQNSTVFVNKLYFCPSTGLCPPGSPGVPDYSIPSYPKFLLGEDAVAGLSKVKLRVSVESYDCPGQKVYSNTSTISYIR